MMTPTNDFVLLDHLPGGVDEVTAGGLVLPTAQKPRSARGLVLARGPLAPEPIEVGMVAVYRPSAVTELVYSGRVLFIVPSKDIYGVENPPCVFGEPVPASAEDLRS